MNDAVDIIGQFTPNVCQRPDDDMAACRDLVRQITHEINTPLQSLLLTLDLLDQTDDQDHDTLTESARAEVRRIGDVLQRLQKHYLDTLADEQDTSQPSDLSTT